MTDEQRKVLEHVVINADEWYAHAVSVFGVEKAQEHLVAKVERWQLSYDAAVAAGDYQTRAEREAQG